MVHGGTQFLRLFAVTGKLRGEGHTSGTDRAKGQR
jgi:hypothetical protein